MKKTVKRLVAMVLAAVLVFALAGCTPEKKAERAVNSFLSEIKKVNIENALSYVDKAEETKGDWLNENTELFIEELFSRLDYEIITSEIVDENTINVTVKLTNVDMKPVIKEFVAEAMKYALSNIGADPEPTEDEVNAKMIEILKTCLNKEGLEMVTMDATIEVVLVEGAWKISIDGSLMNAMLGGLSYAAWDLSKSFS